MKYYTNNQDWGFFGTIIVNFDLDDKQATELFDYACRHLKRKGMEHWQFCMDGFGCKTPIDFLDSRTGRHIADAMTFETKNITSKNLEKAFRETMKKPWGKYRR